jgi:hypothetical protein
MSDKSDLEKQADKLLGGYLKSKKRNKVASEEYPILSDSQLKRRRSKEIPMSSLSRRQAHKVDEAESLDE